MRNPFTSQASTIEHHAITSAPGVDDNSVMAGSSPEMQHLFAQLQKAALVEAPVLITGPAGCGKEIAALSIHRQSARRDGAFIAVHCGTLTSSFFDGELLGRLGAAQGGTLFLDEIGDTPMDTQHKLLRLLEQNLPHVDAHARNIGVRVIAASKTDLVEAVEQGRFREDLYYRINVVSLDIPQLAERGEDIQDIAMFYFTRFANLHNRSLRGFSKSAMLCLLAHRWPGNVRELANRIQRATVMAAGRFIQPEDLGFSPEAAKGDVMSLEEARAEAESAVIRRALSQSRNQISRAASLLGVSRVTLYRLIDKYNIRAEASSAVLKAVPSAATREGVARHDSQAGSSIAA